MTHTIPGLLRLFALMAGLALGSAAQAVATVSATPVGSRAGETVIRLFDAGGAAVSSDPGSPNSFSNLAPGSYSAETVVGGKVVGGRQGIRLEDGANQLRADSDTGEIRVLPLLARRQQQQQIGWSFGLLGGYKRTPFDFSFNTVAGNASASGDLEESASSVALEVRHSLRNMEALGARLFLFGTFIEYFGTDAQRLLLNLHPAPGNDSGARVEEKRAFMFGVGGRWNLAQRLGAELMIGAHATRLLVAAVSDESCCGGPLNVLQRDKTMWGPMIAAGLTYPLVTLAAGRTVYGLARWTGVHLRDVTASGTSPFTGWDYSTTVRGGWQHNFQLGVGLNY